MATNTLSAFSRYKSFGRLQQLAENPFDLTQEGSLTPQRLEKFSVESCGYLFSYATERIDEETVLQLTELAVEAGAIEKMEKMQSGETMNYIIGHPSENRKVLHTATRDIFDHPQRAPAAVEAAHAAHNQLEKLQKFINKINQESLFTDLITVGIGGSDLGPKAHYIALEHLKIPGRNVHFICNIDPDEIELVLRRVDLQKTLVLIISKSGTTLETLTNEEFLRTRFIQQGLVPHEHFVSISCQGSPLDQQGSYLETFYLWDWIGGRYSTTSMVGGVLLSFAFGYETFHELLRGAHAMDHVALSRDIKENLPLLGALLTIWNRSFLGYPHLCIVPYAQALARFPAHIQQVEMESNGKQIDQRGYPVDFGTGLIIFGEPGSAAQHSFFQLIHQGTTVVPIEFIGFKTSQMKLDQEINGSTLQQKLLANMFAQSLALAQGRQNINPNKLFPGNRPSHLLLTESLTPYSLGALLAYYEHKTAFQGFIWGINSFDQEGVQLGKELSQQIINKFAEANGLAFEQSQPSPLADTYLSFLARL